MRLQLIATSLGLVVWVGLASAPAGAAGIGKPTTSAAPSVVEKTHGRSYRRGCAPRVSGYRSYSPRVYSYRRYSRPRVYGYRYSSGPRVYSYARTAPRYRTRSYRPRVYSSVRIGPRYRARSYRPRVYGSRAYRRGVVGVRGYRAGVPNRARVFGRRSGR